MTRFARIHRNKSANIKAAPEEATSWAEFKAQMKSKKEISQTEEQESDLNGFSEAEHYYAKNTYKSGWCDFETNSDTESKTKNFCSNRTNADCNSEEVDSWGKLKTKMKSKKQFSQDEKKEQNLSEFSDTMQCYDENSWCNFDSGSKKSLKIIKKHKVIDDKGKRLTSKANREKKRKHQEYKDNNEDDEKECILAAEDTDTQSAMDINFHQADSNSKKKKKSLLNKVVENFPVCSEEVEPGQIEIQRKSKKRKFQKTTDETSSKISDNDQEQEVDDINSKSSRQENRFERGNKHGRSDKVRKKNPRNDMTLEVDGKNVKMIKYDGFYILETDAERITKLKQKMLEEGRSKADIEGVIKRHRRNAEKSAAKKRKRLCFHCREGVHNLAQCPKLDGPNGPVGTSICYKCGSTEHSLYQCKLPGNDLKFAKCFICNEVGHLSKQCPDNPRGLYPNGGSCRVCGDVTHLKRDCPELIKKKRYSTFTVGTIGDCIDSLDDDLKPKSKKLAVTSKRVNKIIRFE